MLAIHAVVFPFDRQGAGVARVVQRADDFLEVHAAVAERAEIPAAARIAEVQVAGENPALAIQPDDRVLHVDVENPVGEFANKPGGVHALPDQVAGIEIEAEFRPEIEGLQRPLRRVEIEGDLGRVHFEGEFHATLAEHVEDRVPTLGQELKTGVDHGGRHRRERVEQVPDARAGETVDHLDAELLRRAGGVLHVLGRASADALRPAVAPDVGGQDRLVPGVDMVQDRLAGQVVADGKHRHAVPLQQAPLALAVVGFGDGPGHLEVIARAGQLQSVEAEFLGLGRQGLKRQIGPLARTQRNRPGHVEILLSRERSGSVSRITVFQQHRPA